MGSYLCEHVCWTRDREELCNIEAHRQFLCQNHCGCSPYAGQATKTTEFQGSLGTVSHGYQTEAERYADVSDISGLVGTQYFRQFKP